MNNDRERRKKRTEDIRRRHALSTGQPSEENNSLSEISLEPEATESSIQDGDSTFPPVLTKYHLAAFVSLFAFRLANALAVKTFHVPDEYWQASEVAHRMVFGYGYLTWEWIEGIRGYSHPLIFAAGYKLLAVLGLDDTELIIYVPQATQAFLAAVGDWHVHKLATRFFGPRAAKYALIAQLTSWWNVFCSTRTLANSAEATLSAVALTYWPRSHLEEKWSARRYRVALIWAAAACTLRPTNAVLWIFLGARLMFDSPKRIFEIIVNAVLILIIAISTMLSIDRYFYGEWVFTPLAFVNLNITRGVSLFYGSHPWFWYLTHGFPLVVFTALPFFCLGMIRDRRTRPLVYLITWVVAGYSFLAHKEMRFLYPIVPAVMAVTGAGIESIDRGSIIGKTIGDDDDDDEQTEIDIDRVANEKKMDINAREAHLPDASSDSASRKEGNGKRRMTARTRLALTFLAMTNFALGFYLTQFHQRGVVDVMSYLRREARRSVVTGDARNGTLVTSIGFLMPCHSTPFYSHIHRHMPMWFLTCEPPLTPDTRDEADEFYADPRRFISRNFVPLGDDNDASTHRFEGIGNGTAIGEVTQGRRHRFSWPSHLVVFDALLDEKIGVADILKGLGYRETARFFNAHFHDDPRRKGDVVVLSRS